MELLENTQTNNIKLNETISSPDYPNQISKKQIFWIRFFAYIIPISFLLYILYINFLPFGYNKTYIINVGSPNDTKISEFYLLPSLDLSSRKIDKDNFYRELNGSASVIFNPKTHIPESTITISANKQIKDEANISIILPKIGFNQDSIKWDYIWDFSPNINNNKATIPEGLVGNAFVFDNEVIFNGIDTRLILPNTADKFEEGPFTIYLEWKPKNNKDNAQQIVGHFNWEIWQNKDNVEFRIGRMNDAQGPAYSVKYPVTPDFFDNKHSAIAIYNPGTKGYIDLYIDNNFAGRTHFGEDKNWKDYNKNENLSFGWTPHNYNKSPYFLGSIYKVKFIYKNIFISQSQASFKSTFNYPINISLETDSTTTIKQIQLNVHKK